MLIQNTGEKIGKIFYGWWIVTASGVINAFGGGVYFYGFSVFFLPIKQALTLSSAATSLVFSLSRAEGAVEGPLAGYLVDRFGPRKMITIGVIVVAIGYILLSQVTNFTSFLIVYLGIISLAFNASFSGATMAVVNNWFIRRKGMAMSISIAAYSLGGAIIAPLLALAIHHFGWRWAVTISGILLAATVIPFAQLLRPSPESMGLLPDGDSETSSSDDQTISERRSMTVDFTVKEALSTTSYWLLATGTMLRTGTLGTLIVHFIPIMVWKGNSEPAAAAMLGTLAFISIPTRIGMGWLGDRWSRPKMLSAGMLLGALALIFLKNSVDLWQLWAFIVIFSVVEGISGLNWALVGDYFGRRRFATLRGILSLVYSWGMIIMPVTAGMIFDRTGSYDLALWVFVSMYIAGALVFAILRRPRLPTS